MLLPGMGDRWRTDDLAGELASGGLDINDATVARLVQFLDQAAASGYEPDAASEFETSVTLPGAMPATIAQRYEIEARIAEGGMGCVYRVRHLRLGKTFALKLIREGLTSDLKTKERFFREARLASGLSHPNVVSVVDFGEDARYGAFMVMELVEGEQLFQFVRQQGRLTLKPALDIMLQVSEAVRYMHERGIVHGDLKSENLLVFTETTDLGRRRHQVRLLDFGLARSAQAQASMPITGTPLYMAPERISGAPMQPTNDIYSLGILFFELLVGQPPFVGAIQEVLAGHLHQSVPALATVLGEPVDDRVEQLIQRAVKKQPELRHKNVEDFIGELRGVADMMGFGRRRPREKQNLIELREALVQQHYDLNALPMATLDHEGTILAHNPAFAAFVGAPGQDLMAALLGNVGTNELVRACPTLLADIRTVYIESRSVVRGVRFEGEGKGTASVLLWLTPGLNGSGLVNCTIHLAGRGKP